MLLTSLNIALKINKGITWSAFVKRHLFPGQPNIVSMSNAEKPLKLLTQKEAQQIDEILFNEYEFSVDQLMELAGLSCAVAIAKCFPKEKWSKNNSAILICCGPGNNGGDGLVCARHLKLFGYNPSIFYPKRPSRAPLSAMRIQCEKMDIPFLSYLPSEVRLISDSYNVIVDALFGFSFIGPPRAEFQTIITKIMTSKVPVASIDVPSGWEVDNGNEDGMQPELLVSLTAPKVCSRSFKGKYHYLGGRFIPQELAKRYQLNLPSYPGTDCIVELLSNGAEKQT